MIANLKNHLSNPLQTRLSDLVSLYPLFRDHLSIVVLPQRQLAMWAHFLNHGLPFLLPRLRLVRWIDWTLKDDALLQIEGVNSMTGYELMEACDERGAVDSESPPDTRYADTSLHLFFSNQNSGFLNIVGTKKDEAKVLLAAHIRYTKMLVETAYRLRPQGDKNRSGLPNTPLDVREIGAIGSMIMLARALNVCRFD